MIVFNAVRCVLNGISLLSAISVFETHTHTQKHTNTKICELTIITPTVWYIYFVVFPVYKLIIIVNELRVIPKRVTYYAIFYITSRRYVLDLQSSESELLIRY